MHPSNADEPDLTAAQRAPASALPNSSSDEVTLGWLRLTTLRRLGVRERGFLRGLYESHPYLFTLDPHAFGALITQGLAADPHGDQVSLPADTIEQLLRPGALTEARAELARARRLGVALVTIESPDYPALLQHAPDPPLVVSVRGALAPVPRRTIAIVGARRAGSRELEVAYTLARDLAARGVVIASGLAKGVDRAAHEGALDAPGGRTVAVLGCGLARTYPTANDDLVPEVLARGALLSELPIDAPPRKQHFPQRNRIVSGVAAATIVVGAGENSGALITAMHARDQDREVYAVPGRIDDEFACGPNHLIRRNLAKLVESAAHVLEDLWQEGTSDPLVRARRVAPKAPPRPPLDGVPGQVEALLGTGRPRTFDELAEHSRLPPSALIVALGRLQGCGRVRTRGSLYELVE